ncbi:hypothetical protein F5X99DRAFT_412999 [Biscogniauxia marginata]|nr:hypothetical protein F5X99DRAFT_412999 [Biscogniauxia marginata]
MSRANMIRPIRQALSRPLLAQQSRNALSPFALVRPESTLADGEPEPKPPQLVNELPDPREENEVRLPRAVQALYLQPLRREAEYGVPTCDLQLRSFSIPNLEFFCDFALRAAYYLNLPAFGPVPLPKITERWTVPKSHFIFKKSQENFERITRRRLIQIKDGHPETVQIWLAYLQRHAYYGIGMKANMWQYGKLDTGKQMNEEKETMQQIIEQKMKLLGRDKILASVDKVKELLASERPLVVTARQLLLSAKATGRRSNSGAADTGDSDDGARENAVIFSGIQPTGTPHLGNYLGAMRSWKKLQDDAQGGDKLFFSIVDLHALTVPQDAEALRIRKREMLAALLAVGLDPKKSNIFYQSSVPQHSELMWILSCTASMGYLSRMTQWKTKLQASGKHMEFDGDAVTKLKLGLYSYPVLQAADILVHRATSVPVGSDQKQHLEFARECVTNFNHSVSRQVLVYPKTITADAPRIMSLVNPRNKMSKSVPNEKSRLLITADEAEIRQRIMGATTDSTNDVTYEPLSRPGIANLLEILAQCSSSNSTPEGKLTAPEFADRFRGANLKYLKTRTADAVVAELAGIRDRYMEALTRRGGCYVDEVEAEGAAAARENAEETMKSVRRAVGIA